MGYASLRECLVDLERAGQLRRIQTPLDPHLEIPAIQRRVYAAQGPALCFEQVKGSELSAVSNLFGTLERGRWLFRDTLDKVKGIIQSKADPESVLRAPWKKLNLLGTAASALPRQVRSGPVQMKRCKISDLPAIHSWPQDGGPFITLPQVCSLHPERPVALQSNLGMYRVQLSGNEYRLNEEVGMHYQIHRGIGVHHSAAKARNEPLPVSIFVGGPPAHTLAAVMPLPEGLSELAFAGLLGGRRFRYLMQGEHLVSADADVCILGYIDPERCAPEGPFGDHLGYYSLKHDFPVMRVTQVYRREDAIWPFTVVGRPPQEDTTFGALIHELTAPMVPVSVPGLKSMHAVDAAGVHPLLLALGNERYVPYRELAPKEILTVANAVLGFGQASLAKYLLIGAAQDSPAPDPHHEEDFFSHILARIDLERDLHFQTRTTMDTLDYSGTGLNQGSKLVMAACGPARRSLGTQLPAKLSLPSGFSNPRVVSPGILAVKGPEYRGAQGDDPHPDLAKLATHIENEIAGEELAGWVWLTVVDDPDSCARSFANWLWICFTRSNPSHDIHGVHARTRFKHWGCKGPMIVDARRKEHHAPPLEEDPEVTRAVEALAAPGGPLHGLY